MKICLLTAFFTPGMGYQENNWAKISVELGHELLVVSTDLVHSDVHGLFPDRVEYGERFVLVRVKATRLPCNLINLSLPCWSHLLPTSLS